MSEDLLDHDLLQPTERRRKLLPIWIKVFTWFFLIAGAILPFVIVFGILGINAELSLYGLSSVTPFSIIGGSVSLLFALKAVTAYGLWFEKDWAVRLAKVDGLIGIIICGASMFILPFVGAMTENSVSFNFNFRLELIPLIFYVIKMNKIESEWQLRS